MTAPALRPESTVGIRRELVARVRREIEGGTYETPDKIDTAVERMAVDLA